MSPLFILLALLTGFLALGYQVLWLRTFSIQLGHDLPATYALMMAFFGGLALGAKALEPLIHRSTRPGILFVLLETLAGLWAASSLLWLIPYLQWVQALIGLTPSSLRFFSLAFLLPSLALLPTTLLLGASLPALERWHSHLHSNPHAISPLYAIHTLGALLASLLLLPFLVPNVGFQKTFFLLITLHLLVCLLAGFRSTQPVQPQIPASNSPSNQSAPPVPFRRFTLFLTGFLGVGLEVLVLRNLSHSLDNGLYNYTTLLSIYLLATTLGTFLSIHPKCSVLRNLPFLLLGLVVTSLLTLGLLHFTPFWNQSLQIHLPSSPLLQQWIVQAPLIFPPALLMGATFRHLLQDHRLKTSGIGSALAWNTFGATLSPPLWGAWAIPWFGLQGAFQALAACYLLLLGFHRRNTPHWVFLVLVALLSISFKYPPSQPQLPENQKILSYKEGPLASVAVLEYSDHNRSLQVNHRFLMGGTGAASATRRQAHLPLLFHASPKEALFVGLGTGITLGACTSHPNLKATGIDILPEIIQALPYFQAQNNQAGFVPNLQVQCADARRYIHLTPQSYDLIVSDLFHPVRDGAGLLYTREHFQNISEKLTDGGLHCQWLPLFQLHPQVLLILLNTYLQVFPHTHALLLRNHLDTPVLGLISTKNAPLQFTLPYLPGRIQSSPALLQELKIQNLLTDLQLFGTWIAGPSDLLQLCKSYPINTDDHPILLFLPPTLPPLPASYFTLFYLLDRLPLQPQFPLFHQASGSSTDFTQQLTSFIQARNLYLTSLRQESENHLGKAFEILLQSAETSKDFTLAPAQAITWSLRYKASQPQLVQNLLQQLAQLQPESTIPRRLLLEWFPSGSPE